MNLTPYEMVGIGAAVAAILMVGSGHLRVNLTMYALQTVLIAVETGLYAYSKHEDHFYFVAAAIFLVKAYGVPRFLSWIIKHIEVRSDPGTVLPTPLVMHLSIILFGLSYLLACQLPAPGGHVLVLAGASAAISLVFTGLLMMLTRRIALSQIIGFLTMENGIYLFALTQTEGMPMMVEMGILLDVLGGVMIAGLLAFKIKKSFEHIDVTQLTRLRD